MRPLLKTGLISILMLMGASVWGQSTDEEGFPTFTFEEGDTTFTMRQYVFVLYVAVPDREALPEDEANLIQQAHMEYINQMADEHNLVIAGPMGDDSDWRGILIFNDHDVERVREIVSQDPAVQAGRLTIEVHPWWAARGSKLP